MSRRNIIDAKDDHIKTLRILLGVSVMVIAALWYGWKSAPNHILVDIPPDIRTGSTQHIGERLPTTIYTFAYYIFQQLNRWPTNGETDYKGKIYGLQNYLTPACSQFLQEDFDKRRLDGELRDRERTVVEMSGRGYDDKRVYIESDGSWIVYLDLQITEVYRGERVKDVFARYPLRVVRYERDPEGNRYQLQLDCFADTPKKLEFEPKPVPPNQAAHDQQEPAATPVEEVKQ